MKLLTSRIRFIATAAILLTAACESPAVLQPEQESLLNKSAASHDNQADLLRSVRQATNRFHSTTQARKRGYQDPGPGHCVAVPGFGGMGYHWENHGLVDEVFDPLQPEVLLYAPHKNGKLKLVAVEYVVLDFGQDAPTFAGQEFDAGGVPPLEAENIDHWSLHVWVHRDNPDGVFAPFNPNVSCG